MDINNLIDSKINKLNNEHNDICNRLSEIKGYWDNLTNRKVEIEGALKALSELIDESNMQRSKDNDTEDRTS